MQLLFKNTTKCSQKVYLDFLKFHNSVFGLKHLLYTIFIIFLITYLIYSGIKLQEYFVVLILALGLVIFTLYRFYKPKCQVDDTWNSKKVKEEQSFEFSFYPSYFMIKALDEKETISIDYLDLYKIFDVPNYFYLYFDKEHSYIIDKFSFSKGSSTEFSNYFKRKYFYKYKRKNK